MKQLFLIREDGSRFAINADMVQSITRKNGKITVKLKNGQTLILEEQDQLVAQEQADQTENISETIMTHDATDAHIESFEAIFVESNEYAGYIQAAAGLLGVGAIVAAASGGSNNGGGGRL